MVAEGKGSRGQGAKRGGACTAGGYDDGELGTGREGKGNGEVDGGEEGEVIIELEAGKRVDRILRLRLRQTAIPAFAVHPVPTTSRVPSRGKA